MSRLSRVAATLGATGFFFAACSTPEKPAVPTEANTVPKIPPVPQQILVDPPPSALN